MRGASERANGRVSGPVLQSVFLAVLAHCFFFLVGHSSHEEAFLAMKHFLTLVDVDCGKFYLLFTLRRSHILHRSVDTVTVSVFCPFHRGAKSGHFETSLAHELGNE